VQPQATVPETPLGASENLGRPFARRDRSAFLPATMTRREYWQLI
jgi:hypothetical protein